MQQLIDDELYNRLLFLGDTHGENMGIPYLLKQCKVDIQEYKAIVHVGDFGIGFSSTVRDEIRKLDILNQRLKENNITLYIVRGNHDDPSWFKSPTYEWTHITFVPDHTLLTINLKDTDRPIKIYCHGGAISVDRSNKMIDVNYWPEEEFICPSPEQLLEIPTDLDIIVTHTRPLGVEPSVYNTAVMNYCSNDDKLDNDLIKEQKDMKRMFESIRKRNNVRNNIVHYFGHFHWSKRERIGDIAHVTLAIKELSEYYIRKD
jgi:predicted phosphodiesterase